MQKEYTYPNSSYPPDVLAARGNMTDIELTRYVNRLYGFLLNLPNSYCTEVKKISEEPTRPLFIACVKMFIQEVPMAGISFSYDYQFIKK